MSHSRKCLANMIICAVENARDSENISDATFVEMADSGSFLFDAYGYLDDPNLCTCPPSESCNHEWVEFVEPASDWAPAYTRTYCPKCKAKS